MFGFAFGAMFFFISIILVAIGEKVGLNKLDPPILFGILAAAFLIGLAVERGLANAIKRHLK